MSKWSGKIGFVVQKEYPIGSDIWIEDETERTYYGDMIRNSRRLQNSSNQNDNLVISNQLSIVADPFAYENFHSIRYAYYMNTKWKVTDIEVQYPRLILTLGEVYNAH